MSWNDRKQASLDDLLRNTYDEPVPVLVSRDLDSATVSQSLASRPERSIYFAVNLLAVLFPKLDVLRLPGTLLCLILVIGCSGGGKQQTDRRPGAGSRGSSQSSDEEVGDDGSRPLTPSHTARQRAVLELDDPQADGWHSEALHQQVKTQLKQLGKAMTLPPEERKQAASKLLAGDFCLRSATGR